MNKIFQQFIFIIILIFIGNCSLSANYPDYENVYVNDWAKLLNTRAEQEVTQKIMALKKETGVEITLVTIRRMSDYPNTARTIEGFGLGLFNYWGVGNKDRNDGVLVLVSHKDRKMRIATGIAYDGTDKNAIAKKIIENDFIPHFKQDNYQKGILTGMDMVINAFNPEYTVNTNSSLPVGLMHTPSNVVSSNSYGNNFSQIKVFAIIFGGIVLLNLLKSFFSVSSPEIPFNEKFYTQGNYAIDKQPISFKQTFPNEKKVNAGIYLGFFFLGLMALLFVLFFIGFNYFKASFLGLLAGTGFTYARAELQMRKRNKPKSCPRCNNTMERLSERNDDEHLHLPERVEESLKSIDYDVWLCGDCQNTKKLRFPYWQSTVENCKQCEYKTLEIDINTLKTATTSREGLEEVIQDCKYCDYHHEYQQIIPMVPDHDDDSGSSGGSFGGGSSSGGGASGSW